MEMKAVNSLSDYVKRVTSNYTYIPEKPVLPYHNPKVLFRGHSDSTYELIPAIGRGRRTPAQPSLLDQERNMIELAKIKKPELFSDSMKPIELLALMQHHGIPTRLLDVTENALVALYFACCSNPHIDGEVLVFLTDDYDVSIYPIVNAIAESYKYAFGTITSIESFFGRVKNQNYFLEQKYDLEELYNNNAKGAEWVKSNCVKPIFVMAPIRSLRQMMQQGRYLLFPNRIDEEDLIFKRIIDPLPKENPLIVDRIRIDNRNKKEFLEQLRMLGISKETMFFDDTDVVCSEIVEDCKHRNQNHSTIYFHEDGTYDIRQTMKPKNLELEDKLNGVDPEKYKISLK